MDQLLTSTSTRMVRGPLFRNLPLELRRQIYQYLFVQSEIIYVNKNWSEPTDLIRALSSFLCVDAEESTYTDGQESDLNHVVTTRSLASL